MNCLFSKVSLRQVIIEKKVLLDSVVSYNPIDALFSCTIKYYVFIYIMEGIF